MPNIHHSKYSPFQISTIPNIRHPKYSVLTGFGILLSHFKPMLHFCTSLRYQKVFTTLHYIVYCSHCCIYHFTVLLNGPIISPNRKKRAQKKMNKHLRMKNPGLFVNIVFRELHSLS